MEGKRSSVNETETGFEANCNVYKEDNCDRGAQAASVFFSVNDYRKAPIAIGMTSTVGDLTYGENADMHFMCGLANGNGGAALHHAQFPERRMPDYRIFQ
ncbi:hypothetical protein TNCV_2179011 [Trichonephila clavipes]|uniref:Uncharacterized protein n=1 Tax=Trichonephila clavipes TaxID=2585209 RepID=A0A8X6VUG5_TRICX|nr:hypothetical protein TNCV_2179011 [Trichonephila clavipes]